MTVHFQVEIEAEHAQSCPKSASNERQNYIKEKRLHQYTRRKWLLARALDMQETKVLPKKRGGFRRENRRAGKGSFVVPVLLYRTEETYNHSSGVYAFGVKNLVAVAETAGIASRGRPMPRATSLPDRTRHGRAVGGHRQCSIGHVRALVTEEFYNSGKANAGAQHLSPVCVSKLVRHDADGDSDR